MILARKAGIITTMFLKVKELESGNPAIVNIATIEKVFVDKDGVTCLLTKSAFFKVKESADDLWELIKNSNTANDNE